MKDANRGLLVYWFNKQLFSREWFEQHLDEAIANADQRYIPKLNVDLDIERAFDGLGRTSGFATLILHDPQADGNGVTRVALGTVVGSCAVP